MQNVIFVIVLSLKNSMIFCVYNTLLYNAKIRNEVIT
nr:MAG TPA: hypothetical protein [Caudoviricetes sp.]